MTLAFKNISHRYAKESALVDITLTAKAGEILCLLGQSGCGKTTLLNLTAGVLPLQTGEIHLSEQVLASKLHQPPPEKRPVGLVFQEGALFPHLTVAQNIGFGVKDSAQRKSAVGELLEQIGLEGYGGRYPHTLSGGQQQRVAVARALAPQPQVLLMDEPFANIDIMLRRRLREEMRQLLKARDCVTILVTHDPEEAIETSDAIAIMDKGVIIQHGRADHLYDAPVSKTAAMLMSEGTLVKATRAEKGWQTKFGLFPEAWLKDDIVGKLSVDKATECEICLRPYQIGLKQDPEGYVISDVRPTGQNQLVSLKGPYADILTLHVDNLKLWQVGQTVSLSAQKGSLIAF